uniref:Soluble interferon alpha/beta receptor OPG204 n=1 Tax=Erpetoichthys calabaricus TaxID=27687 RepID=A0A8C4RYF7_ERPCA
MPVEHTVGPLEGKMTCIWLMVGLTALMQGQSEANAGSCKDLGVDFHRFFVAEGEAMVLSCTLLDPLILKSFAGSEYNISWYKNETGEEYTSGESTISAQNELLWFLPASLTDNGHYVCVLRNSVNCIKQAIFVNVHEERRNHCIHDSLVYLQQLKTLPNGNIICSDVKTFIERSEAHTIHWYKECKAIQNDDKFISYGNKLLVQRVSLEDIGIYTCEITFRLNGTEYKATRTIDLNVIGSYFSVYCEVFIGDLPASPLSNIYWVVNETEFIDPSRFTAGNMSEKPVSGGKLQQVQLIITEVKEIDFYTNFSCHVISGKGHSVGYFRLKPSRPSFLVHVGVFFSIILVFTIISAVIYKFFKIDIILWYRKSCHLIRKKQESDGKTYDAYVVYSKNNPWAPSNKAAQFALQILPHVLEKKCGYKLFIFGRDELPGEAVTDVVLKNIQKSRRLIFIYASKLYDEEDPLVLFELHTGLYDALICNKVKVILIELEVIRDYSGFPESVKYFKEKQGAVHWKGSFTGKYMSPSTRFWKQVRYLMPMIEEKQSDKNNFSLSV